MTKIPNISTKSTEGYETFLFRGIDTIQECYCTEFPSGLAVRLDEGQNAAREKHEGQGMAFWFGGEIFQIWSGGSQGNRWVIEDNELQFHFRTDKAGWNVSVRYRAAALAVDGVDFLKERVYSLLEREGFVFVCNNPDLNPSREYERLSRLDFAMDFHSPDFTNEMRDGNIRKNLALTSGVKGGIVFDAIRDETLTIGISKKPTVQIQVYDKGQEIVKSSGKTWMYDLWFEQAGYIPPMQNNGKRRAFDVWRVEVRLFKDFLRDRNILKFDDLNYGEKLWPLLSEALFRRRMVVPEIEGNPVKNHSHKERWDLHPLWAAAYAWICKPLEFVPRDRIITMARKDYIDMLDKQMAGIGRSKEIALNGFYDEEKARESAVSSVELALSDDRHENKIDKAIERQRFIDDPV